MLPATLEVEKQETTLKDKLSPMIEKAKPMEGELNDEFENRREMQRVVLELLPNDILDRLKAHLKYESAVSRKPIDEEAALAGEIFEQLTTIQHEIELRMSVSEVVNSKPIQQLKSLMKRPNEKHFHKIGVFRKPDIIDFQEDSAHDGAYVVAKMFEVKSRQLGPEDTAQLKGFAEGFNKFCDAVKEIPPFEAIEFNELYTAIKRGNIRLGENFSQTLYVPANLDSESIINTSLFDQDAEGEKQLQKLLKGFAIRQSVFSQADLGWITRVFKDELF